MRVCVIIRSRFCLCARWIQALVSLDLMRQKEEQRSKIVGLSRSVCVDTHTDSDRACACELANVSRQMARARARQTGRVYV